MEINNVVYISGTSTRTKWDWSKPFKFHLRSYYVHDTDSFRRERAVSWSLRDKELDENLKRSSMYEVYVLSPEMQGFMTIAEVVDAAHRRKDKCIFLSLKAIEGPGFGITMTEPQMRASDALEELLSNIGARVFKQPNDIINFLLCEAQNR